MDEYLEVLENVFTDISLMINTDKTVFKKLKELDPEHMELNVTDSNGERIKPIPECKLLGARITED